MRVLFVFDYFSPFAGGQQFAVVNWLTNLKKLGVTVSLLTDQHVALSKDIEAGDYIINPSLSLGRFFGHVSIPLWLTEQTKKAILAFKPDIIHIQDQYTLSYSTLRFAKFHQIPTITSFHGTIERFTIEQFPLSLFVGEGKPWNKFLEHMQAAVLKQSELLTAPSAHYQHIVERQFRKKTFVLYNPINEAFFGKKSPLPAKVTKLITMSRLAGEKKISLLLAMLSYLDNRFTLTIVGEGTDKKYLEEKAKQLGLEKLVTFTGWVANNRLPDLLQKHHLFISASDFETFGATYIEALATYLPCVVYDYEVPREVIPNDMAIFVKSFDPKVWAKALMQLQENAQMYKNLRLHIDKNYQLLNRYHEVESAKRLLHMYEEILKGKNRGERKISL